MRAIETMCTIRHLPNKRTPAFRPKVAVQAKKLSHSARAVIVARAVCADAGQCCGVVSLCAKGCFPGAGNCEFLHSFFTFLSDFTRTSLIFYPSASRLLCISGCLLMLLLNVCTSNKYNMNTKLLSAFFLL